MTNRAYRKILLGMGLDCKDGHVRVTKGENFALFGGSHETHEMMQEKAIKFNEHLNKRKKNLEDISEKEAVELQEMTDSRNDTSHTYKEEVAQAIYEKIGGYAALIEDTLKKVRG